MAFPWVAAAMLGSAGLSFLGSSKASTDQMDFQREMSSTSYVRSMADMRAAGLNPMLAYQRGGASTPGGAGGSAASDISGALSTALQVKRVAAEIKNIHADTEKKKAEQMTTDTQGALNVMNYRIQRENLNSAKASASQAQIEKAFWESKWGKAMKILDMTGRSINPFASSAKEVKKLGE